MSSKYLKPVFIIVIFTFVLFQGMFAQQFQLPSLSQMPDSIKRSLAVIESPEYLDSDETLAFVYTNLVRMFPKFFLDEILKPYGKEKKLEKNAFFISLKKELQALSSLHALQYRNDLHDVAKSHAVSCGKSGKVGHQNFEKRFAPYRDNFDAIGENCAYGNQNGAEHIISLLIDEGVADLGHRKNLLNTRFYYVGNSIQPHKIYEINYVQCFGGKLL